MYHIVEALSFVIHDTGVCDTGLCVVRFIQDKHYPVLVSGCFFFKQKTADEIEYGLVGSEMCIRDSLRVPRRLSSIHRAGASSARRVSQGPTARPCPVSYTHLTLPTSDLV